MQLVHDDFKFRPVFETPTHLRRRQRRRHGRRRRPRRRRRRQERRDEEAEAVEGGQDEDEVEVQQRRPPQRGVRPRNQGPLGEVPRPRNGNDHHQDWQVRAFPYIYFCNYLLG